MHCDSYALKLRHVTEKAIPRVEMLENTLSNAVKTFVMCGDDGSSSCRNECEVSLMYLIFC
jgi:hypothetical protein